VPSDGAIALRSFPLRRKHPTGSPPPGFAFQRHRYFHVQPHHIHHRLLSGHSLHFAPVRALRMAWGTLNVGEQRARLVARPATGALPAPSRRHFLIANLELKLNVSYIRINDLKFSNRKFSAVFHPQPQKACHKRARVSPEARGAHLPPPLLLAGHSSLITGHCLPNRDTAIKNLRNLKKTKSIPISNRDQSGTFGSRFIPSRSPRRARVATSHASLRDHLPAFSASMLESKTI